MIFELKYKLTALSPLFIGSGSAIGVVQKQVLLDSNGYPVIKGSTLKGTIRYHLTRFLKSLPEEQKEAFRFSSVHNPHDIFSSHQDNFPQRPDPIAIIFGSPQIPGQLFFSDAKLNRQDYPDPSSFFTDTRTGTAIDRKLGVVRRNHLYTTELIPAGVIFRGRIFGRGQGGAFLSDLDNKAPLFLVPLLMGLRLTTHIGGGKSRGLGACRIETETLYIDDKLQDINKLPRLQDLWEQFVELFPLRWEEEQGAKSI